MRAIQIRPTAQTVEEIDIDMTVGSIQEAVGGGMMEIAHEFDNGDVLYVNEDGLGHGQEALAGAEGRSEFAAYFDLGLHQPFAGPGVIVGGEVDGRHVGARTSLDRVRREVSFLLPVAATAEPGPSGAH